MIPEPECRRGYPWTQIYEMFDEDVVEDLESFMVGQTMTICEAAPQREWIDDPDAPGGMRLVEVGPPLCDRPHGPVVYTHDLERWMRGGPIVD